MFLLQGLKLVEVCCEMFSLESSVFGFSFWVFMYSAEIKVFILGFVLQSPTPTTPHRANVQQSRPCRQPPPPIPQPPLPQSPPHLQISAPQPLDNLVQQQQQAGASPPCLSGCMCHGGGGGEGMGGGVGGKWSCNRQRDTYRLTRMAAATLISPRSSSLPHTAA